MKSSFRRCIIPMLCLLVSSCGLLSAVPAPSPETISAVAHGNTAFAVDLYQRLCQQDGNLFFSPFSISSALAMTRAGAAASTAQQMDAVLYFNGLPDPSALHETFAVFLQTLNSSGEAMKLSIANSLWGAKDYEFLPAFLKQLEQQYGAGLERVNFSNAEAARQQINDWVAGHTGDLIKDLIPPGLLTPLTRLVLVNAIYFKGMWETAFNKKATQEHLFYLAGGKAVKTPLMNRTGSFSYAETDEMQILEIPYKGGQVAMTIFLPAKVDTLPAFESGMTSDVLQNHLSALVPDRKVNVFLPRFKSTGSFSLSGSLKALGMTDAFSREAADFSGMTGKRDLMIDEVVHKAFCDVSEEGTEAAAATAVIMAPRSAAPRKDRESIPIFRADRPFVYLIRDLKYGNILFMGRFSRPEGNVVAVPATGADTMQQVQPGGDLPVELTPKDE